MREQKDPEEWAHRWTIKQDVTGGRVGAGRAQVEITEGTGSEGPGSLTSTSSLQ